MKFSIKSIFAVATLIGIIGLAACSKKSDPAPVVVSNSFTLRGNTFTVSSAVDSANYFGVIGTTSTKQKAEVIFIFSGSSRPAAGSYKVISDISKQAANQVGILAFDSLSVAKESILGSLGTDNVSAQVTVSALGKITITLASTQLTGSNIDNTDPKNTNITTLNTTLSGTFIEK
jgi:hypothetical protein